MIFMRKRVEIADMLFVMGSKNNRRQATVNFSSANEGKMSDSRNFLVNFSSQLHSENFLHFPLFIAVKVFGNWRGKIWGKKDLRFLISLQLTLIIFGIFMKMRRENTTSSESFDCCLRVGRKISSLMLRCVRGFKIASQGWLKECECF